MRTSGEVYDTRRHDLYDLSLMNSIIPLSVQAFSLYSLMAEMSMISIQFLAHLGIRTSLPAETLGVKDPRGGQAKYDVQPIYRPASRQFTTNKAWYCLIQSIFQIYPVPSSTRNILFSAFSGREPRDRPSRVKFSMAQQFLKFCLALFTSNMENFTVI